MLVVKPGCASGLSPTVISRLQHSLRHYQPPINHYLLRPRWDYEKVYPIRLKHLLQLPPLNSISKKQNPVDSVPRLAPFDQDLILYGLG